MQEPVQEPAADEGSTSRSAAEQQVAESERVARVLAELRAGVRQRQGELASLGIDPVANDVRLARAWALSELHEPPCESPRPLVGKLLVALRRTFFDFFVRWHAAPLRQQQSELNQEHVRLLGEVLSELAELRRRHEQLERQLGRLARRLDAAEPQEREPGRDGSERI